MPTKPTHSADPSYPEPLRVAEQAAVRERRQRAGLPPDTPLVGVALSGGGIRSATFCLGLFQALARQKLIHRIDVLSSVSGGGYFASFLGTAFSREGSSAAAVERDLADNHSWPVKWLRENGRFLSPNGAGDNWIAAAVALRNWAALHIVLLTFSFFLLAVGALVRADLCTGRFTSDSWRALERFFWDHHALNIWWSPWLMLPVLPLIVLMLPTAATYWLTQYLTLMGAVRRLCGVFNCRTRDMTAREFAGHMQNKLTRGFMVGLVSTVVLLAFAVADSVGQTAYLRWSAEGFTFPAVWSLLTGTGLALFGFGTKITLYIERLLGRRMFRIPADVAALALALLWALLIVLGEAVVACGFAWQWEQVWTGEHFRTMTGGWGLMLAIAICFAASWFFSRAFSFVNLSSMQQIYAARLARAYLGATNPRRRRHANHSMTELMAGDDLALDDYLPHRNGGPLHLINVTVNETVSGQTQIERRDRKGLAMSIGPCGLSVGIDSHALWAPEAADARTPHGLQPLVDGRKREIVPVLAEGKCAHALCSTPRGKEPAAAPRQRIEALPLGRWVAISGAAFTTGTGAHTSFGLSLLLGLANIRLGYWWDSGIAAGQSGAAPTRPNFLELASRVLSRVLPVQTCLMTEFFARFHGPGRRHWYLSDGGHFENTACYELIRRRVPFIICSDAGQDARYEFADFANLVRKARIDFGAEIQVVRRAADLIGDDPGVRFPMPKLEELVHPTLLDVIGTPDDFAALSANDAPDETPTASPARAGRARAHAVLARIHYTDTDEFSWLLLVKPGLMGDEAPDVVQYQRTHPLFPQEPTTDQYFDEAQWESYRKLGEHIGVELFTPPPDGAPAGTAGWSPSQMCAPEPPKEAQARLELAALAARLT